MFQSDGRGQRLSLSQTSVWWGLRVRVREVEYIGLSRQITSCFKGHLYILSSV